MGFMFERTIVVGPQVTVNRLCYDSGAGPDFATTQYRDRVCNLGLSTKVVTDEYGSGDELLLHGYGNA